MNDIIKSKFSIQHKLMIAFSIIILVSNGIIGYVSYSKASSELEASGKIIMQNSVKMIKESIAFKNKEVESGHISLEQAQEDIKELLLGPMNDDGIRPINKNINLGEHGYFFVIGLDGYEVAHPTIEGSYVYDITDMADSSHFITQEMIKKAKLGGGYTYYHWYFPFTQEIAPKINYSELDPVWNWVIVASIYLEDFNKGADSILHAVTANLILGNVFALIIVFYLSKSITMPLNSLMKLINNVIDGNYETTNIPIKNNDEIGILATQFEKMLSTLKHETESRHEAEAELKWLNAELEHRVVKRTNELTNSLSELTLAQSQLIESEKMASLGNIVSGVAHEINTPLGVSITTVSHLQVVNQKHYQLLLDKKMSKTDLVNYMNQVEESSKMLSISLNRAAELVKSFKQIAVNQHANIAVDFNLCEYIQSTLFSLKHEYKNSGHDININCDENIVLHSYPGAFSQIITNLLMNALVHAFEDDDNGSINIDISAENENIYLDFTDTGRGIKPENLSKIFEPFYTTKRGKGGSGLGLNLIYKIVTEQLHGSISCDSEVNVGTAFHLIIPRSVQ